MRYIRINQYLGHKNKTYLSFRWKCISVVHGGFCFHTLNSSQGWGFPPTIFMSANFWRLNFNCNSKCKRPQILMKWRMEDVTCTKLLVFVVRNFLALFWRSIRLTSAAWRRCFNWGRRMRTCLSQGLVIELGSPWQREMKGCRCSKLVFKNY